MNNQLKVESLTVEFQF